MHISTSSHIRIAGQGIGVGIAIAVPEPRASAVRGMSIVRSHHDNKHVVQVPRNTPAWKCRLGGRRNGGGGGEAGAAAAESRPGNVRVGSL